MQIQANRRGLLEEFLANAVVTGDEQGNLAFHARTATQFFAFVA